ncbi:FK506-binding protein 5-like [Harmonia axyridis]|uniref:FK506-binding protein 5-like n=1 Tax=Harmonia axyridis TaxID=115357 RepID=UPI001E2774CC|nr:FK506-binding protein 5-like [Harmonia axyridis]
MMDIFLTRFVIFIFLVSVIEKANSLDKAGDKKEIKNNPFAPNSAIFKIPVSKTVNLDFRHASEKKIESELLKVLADLLKNKAIKQEKIVLNIKPPKDSSTAFVKKFTHLLKEETSSVVPDAVIGAKSTIFKKKSGQISTLRLTLFVIQKPKPVIPRIPKKHAPSRSPTPEESTKPNIEEVNINIEKNDENITATVESALRELCENSTDIGSNKTDILLHVLSSKTITSDQINSLKESVKQILQQTYPDSKISLDTKLFYNKKSQNSKLEFEISLEPKIEKPTINNLLLRCISSPYNKTKPSIEGRISVNDTKSIDNTTKVVEYILGQHCKNITGKDIKKTIILLNVSSTEQFTKNEEDRLKKSLEEGIRKIYPDSKISLQNIEGQTTSKLNFTLILTPKYTPKEILEALDHKLNVTVISANKSVEASLDKMKANLQNLVPYSDILVRAQNIISKDLDLLEKILKSQETKVDEDKIPIDLTKSDSSFKDELEDALPHILSKLEKSEKPVTLAFKITLPNEGSSVSDDICSIMKTLTSKIPKKTRYGSVDLDVTLIPKSEELLPMDEPLQAGMKPELRSALMPTEVNVINEIKSALEKITSQLQNSGNQSNISMMMPQNVSYLLEHNILDIIRKEVELLFPYSQILIQAQTVISEELKFLKLNIELRSLTEDLERSKENEEVFPVDLSKLEEISPQELEDILRPLWSNLTDNSTMSFDLKLKQVNDIGRGILGNEICSIIDILSKSLPEDIRLDEILLRTTVLPDEELKEVEELSKDQSKEEKDISSKLLDLTNPDTNNTEAIYDALKELVEKYENDTSSILSSTNFTLSIQLPDNETLFTVEEAINTIKDGLLKLVPYTNIIIKTQKIIQNELHLLRVKIQLDRKKPSKKFSIDLQRTGDFLPEEVDEVVFDIRKSKHHPFSFALEMNIPEYADLDASSSEICSVNTIVINNIPKKSILRGTTMRVSVAPRNRNSTIEPTENPRKLEKEIRMEENLPSLEKPSVNEDKHSEEDLLRPKNETMTENEQETTSNINKEIEEKIKKLIENYKDEQQKKSGNESLTDEIKEFLKKEQSPLSNETMWKNMESTNVPKNLESIRKDIDEITKSINKNNFPSLEKYVEEEKDDHDSEKELEKKKQNQKENHDKLSENPSEKYVEEEKDDDELEKDLKKNKQNQKKNHDKISENPSEAEKKFQEKETLPEKTKWHMDENSPKNEEQDRMKNKERLKRDDLDEDKSKVIPTSKPWKENVEKAEKRNKKNSDNKREKYNEDINKTSNETEKPEENEERTEIPIKAFYNDQNDVLRYKENLNLSNATSNWEDILKDVAISVVKIVPSDDKETIEMTLNVIPPPDTTVNTMKDITKALISSLVSALPKDIVNVETEVKKDEEDIVNSAQIKITLSNNNTLGRDIVQEEKLKDKLKSESERVTELNQLLNELDKDIDKDIKTLIQTPLKKTKNIPKQSRKKKVTTPKPFEKFSDLILEV